MNSDIKNNLKINLKNKVEKKCNKNGYVDEVYRIMEYNDGIMIPENLSGCAVYYVQYHCKLCVPIENTIVIAQIQVISPVLILAKNGPIFIFIPRDNVDTNTFDVTNDYLHLKSKEKIKANQYIKVQIINKKINKGDTQINTIGKLLDLASNEEVKKYFGSVIVNNNTIELDENNDKVEEELKEKSSNFII